MSNQFDYDQRILVAIEVNEAPVKIDHPPESYAIFRKLALEEVREAFRQSQNFLVKWITGDKFNTILEERISYWDKLEKPNRNIFVHYARGSKEKISHLFDKIQGENFALTGIYHVLPEASAFAYAFPFGEAPNPWHLAVPRTNNDYSVFWFNFFPPQSYLFEKTFRTWSLFNVYPGKLSGECNQLVYVDSMLDLLTKGLQQFVQINLARFSNFEGFFNSTRSVGKRTFNDDEEFKWYGMLLKKYDSERK